MTLKENFFNIFAFRLKNYSLKLKINMKRLFLFILVGGFLFACQQNPQKHAQDKADDLSKKAEKEAQKASELIEEGLDKAHASGIHATQAEMNEAINSVVVPSFEKNMTANELVKEIGNNAVEYVSSQSEKRADDFATKIKRNLAKIDQLEADGKITADQAASIRDYATSLADKLTVDVEVVVETIE